MLLLLLLLLLSCSSHVRLCDPIDVSPPCSRVPGILQARTLEGVAISFSNSFTIGGAKKLVTIPIRKSRGKTEQRKILY